MQRWMKDLLGRDDWCGREVTTVDLRKESTKGYQDKIDLVIIDIMLGKIEDEDPEVPATALWAM
jgi:hypothetical protein